ncbi:hypothetical protein [Mycolicibacter minnesotensis]|uniref:hypothetical protein n=1 Tax=Mycolicibacter minnesotensis TaxID=1118379 RepID=UPI00138D11AA|nr:hypothetical protein [Mycolicibacter minnesotensis]BBY32575.1 hypothetical protein MMIN_06360 [Mycolicibacter minnesotensis]
MSVNRLTQPRVRLTLVCAGAMALATLGFGVASAKAAPALIDDQMPIPAPISSPAPLGAPSPLGVPGALGAPSPLGVPGALGAPSPLGVPGSAVGGSSAGVNAANSFLQALNGMLNRVVPGVGSIMPTDVSALTPPGAPMSAGPALETPPAPATPPALVPQTLAGARNFSVH